MPNDIIASDLIPASCERIMMKDWTNYPSHRRLCRLSNLTNQSPWASTISKIPRRPTDTMRLEQTRERADVDGVWEYRWDGILLELENRNRIDEWEVRLWNWARI